LLEDPTTFEGQSWRKIIREKCHISPFGSAKKMMQITLVHNNLPHCDAEAKASRLVPAFFMLRTAWCSYSYNTQYQSELEAKIRRT